MLGPGCGTGEEAASTEPPPSRVAAVKATKPLTSAREWCDVYGEPGRAPRLLLPPATAVRADAQAARPRTDRWIWLNLWATWCSPCLREMPLITRWFDSLKNDGVPVDLWFLSVDEEPDTLAGFLRSHPDIAPFNALRIDDGTSLPPFLASLGLKPDTSIPINVLASPGGEVRCVRTGAITDGDYPIIHGLLAQP